jgi:hypothetical protein
LQIDVRQWTIGTVQRRDIFRFLIELAVVALLMLVYFSIRGGLPEPAEEARARSVQIIELEQNLGIYVERKLQQHVIDNDLLRNLSNQIYVWAHFPVIIALAFWLYWRDRAKYGLYRDALLMSAVIGLFAYGLFPTAPPRLMPPEWGFIDTLSHGGEPATFLNDYAAVPSYHFGWVFLALVAVFHTSRNLWLRGGILAITVAMFFAVVVTANHFILDMVVGVAIVLATLGLSYAWRAGWFRRARFFSRERGLKSP